jgi:hypothetical protein
MSVNGYFVLIKCADRRKNFAGVQRTETYLRYNLDATLDKTVTFYSLPTFLVAAMPRWEGRPSLLGDEQKEQLRQHPRENVCLDIDTLATEIDVANSINSESMIRLLEKLEEKIIMQKRFILFLTMPVIITARR